MARSKSSCKTCGVEFDSRGRRDNHQQREHRHDIADTKSMAGRVVQRSEDGKLACPCGRTVLHPRSLRRHRESCRAALIMIESESESSVDVQGMYQSTKCGHVKKGPISMSKLILFQR